MGRHYDLRSPLDAVFNDIDGLTKEDFVEMYPDEQVSSDSWGPMIENVYSLANDLTYSLADRIITQLPDQGERDYGHDYRYESTIVGLDIYSKDLP